MIPLCSELLVAKDTVPLYYQHMLELEDVEQLDDLTKCHAGAERQKHESAGENLQVAKGAGERTPKDESNVRKSCHKTANDAIPTDMVQKVIEQSPEKYHLVMCT